MKKDKRVKILVDGEALVVDHFSGVGHYTADLILALDGLLSERPNIKLEICAPFRRIHRLNKFGLKKAKFRKMPFPTRLSNYLKIKGYQPPLDLILGKRIFLFPNYSSWPTLFSKSIPFIYDLSFVKYPEFVEPRNQQFLVEQVRRSVDRANKIITISISSKREIIEKYGVRPDDVVIAYPAIDHRKFYKRSHEEINRVRAKYGIFGDYILFVGNIEPRKNLKSLILAYEQLDKKIRNRYSLLLIGAKGWLDSDIHDLIISSRMKGNRIIQPAEYVGDKDLPAVYSGSSAFAYVSFYEGFGIPPLEAMACGVPVISSNNSSLPEAVGDAALMIEAENTPQITDALTKVLTNKHLADDLRQRGFTQVDKFSYEKSAKILLEAIEEIS